MLHVEIDSIRGIAILSPDGELSASDFTSAANIIDPYLGLVTPQMHIGSWFMAQNDQVNMLIS